MDSFHLPISITFTQIFAIAIAAAKDGQKITEELFNGEIGWVGWQRQVST
jgi:hypothetical protein